MHPVCAIVGLGNPGPEYAQTRHNIGFHILDTLAASHRGVFKEVSKFEASACQVSMGESSIWLVKPLTFMNRSGRCIGPMARYYKWLPEQIIVVYDEITLDPGRLKLSMRGSAGGHNGIADILTHLGNGFVRFRVGIGPKAHTEMDLADHVLGKFSETDQAWVQQQTPHYLDALQLIVRQGVNTAMNRLNQKPNK